MARLIMIDDNPIEHLIMKKIFERCMIFPDAVHSLDGRNIINLLTAHKHDIETLPDLIFLDLHMPDYSGWDFLEGFNALRPEILKVIDIYIVSSSVDPMDRTRARRYPFVKSFLTKPVAKDTLIAIHLGQGNS